MRGMDIIMRILIKGAGDLASGIAHRLKKAGYQILMTEINVPLTVRRTVAFSRAVYETEVEVEGIKGFLIHNISEIQEVWKQECIPVIVDEYAYIQREYQADVIVDAIIAKHNIGTTMEDAPFVIGVGPGFGAGKDCHAVIETKRGHYLGKVIWDGYAIPNTGIPGEIGGFSTERIIRATADGDFQPIANISEIVEKGQIVAFSGGEPVETQMAGIIRGMLQPGVKVVKGMKCGDIDARCEIDHCFTISDKARAIAGGVLEAVVGYEHLLKGEIYE